MVTKVFIILAVVFLLIVFVWMRTWNDDENETHVPSAAGGGEGDGTAAPVAAAVVGAMRVTGDVLFGKDGRLVKGETFYEGKMKDSSELYIPLKVSMEGKAVLSGMGGSELTPRLQVAVEYGEKVCIASPANAQRQSMLPYGVKNGDTIWVSSNVLSGIALPEYFVLRFFYRVDDGHGYGQWVTADAINIHNR